MPTDLEVTMSAHHREDVILARRSPDREEIAQLNDILQASGLGRPLGEVVDRTPGISVLSVSGADPLAIRAIVPELIPDVQHEVATKDYRAAGEKIGHGLQGWLSAPEYKMPEAPRWHPGGPVVALLDTGVEAHDWLPDPVQGQQFSVEAGWSAYVPIPSPPLDGDKRDLGTHWGHGTFIAGLIRMAAPHARLLSVRVMSAMGKVSELNVVSALGWLADEIDRGRRVDVVLTAFGRRADAYDPGLADLRTALKKLSDRRVPVVAAAGNHGSDVPEYPAAFAADPELSVVSVGASEEKSAEHPEPYSNFGDWVRQWQVGSNIISLMSLPPGYDPADRYAWWSGTSFSAATYAGAVAQNKVVEEPIPAPVPGP
jgi:subtilisin family serine protease